MHARSLRSRPAFSPAQPVLPPDAEGSTWVAFDLGTKAPFSSLTLNTAEKQKPNPGGIGFSFLKNGSPNTTVDSPTTPSAAFEITTDKLTLFRHFDKDYLQEQYVVLGKSMNEIARDRGCSRSAIKAALEELGFTIKPRSDLNCSKGQVPFGYRVLNGRLVTHEGETAVLNQMLQWRTSGASFGEIAQRLNARGIKTKNRVRQWDRPTVFRMLRKLAHAATSS